MRGFDEEDTPCQLCPYCCPHGYGSIPHHANHHYHYDHIQCIPTGRLLAWTTHQTVYPMIRYDNMGRRTPMSSRTENCPLLFCYRTFLLRWRTVMTGTCRMYSIPIVGPTAMVPHPTMTTTIITKFMSRVSPRRVSSLTSFPCIVMINIWTEHAHRNKAHCSFFIVIL